VKWESVTDPTDKGHSYTRIIRTDGKTNPLQCGAKSRAFHARQKPKLGPPKPRKKNLTWQYYLDGEEMNLENIAFTLNLTYRGLQNMFYPGTSSTSKEAYKITKVGYMGRIVSRTKRKKRIFTRNGKPCNPKTIRYAFNKGLIEIEEEMLATKSHVLTKKGVRFSLRYVD
jgi:hypothetical protein